MIAVLTGAGISADSGIATFRDSDGLWANYRVEDVCTPEALERHRERVIDFYNMRRRELLNARPNAAHFAIARLERETDTCVITQNIDDLHERAGTRRLIHLHGELRKLRSSRNETATIPISGWEQHPDDRHPDGSLLRPFVVFFGESVPRLTDAADIVRRADTLLIIGTSLNVYPAASLVHYIRPDAPIYIVDPDADTLSAKTRTIPNPITAIPRRAADGVPPLVDHLLSTPTLKSTPLYI